MKTHRLLAALFGLILPLTAACAGPNLCERKDRFMTNRCAGGDVTYHRDATCEEKIARCTPSHLAQLEGYVSCLESQNVCSMEALAQCAQAYPGGVNLACS